ncbi:unnamed protein product [Ectocarpus sp. 4 AP-2014]
MSFFGRVRLSRAAAQGSTDGALKRTSGSALSARSRQGAGCARYPAAAGPTPRLAPGRAIAASAMVPSAPLVTMVPWVPAPFQPLMNMLHPIMIKDRRPLESLGISTVTNAGSLCGHLSFAILTAAYLETDVLTLRVLVLSGSTLNIMFNMFRVVGPPVWIPIKWNVGFLALNAVMVLLLMNEREEAEELGKDPEQQARIFREIFMPAQLSPVHFLRLMDVAERRVMLKGNDLNQEGRPHEEVFLIAEGTAEVKSEGVVVSHLASGGFVGSMAFNRFVKSPSPNSTKKDGEGGTAYRERGIFTQAWEAFLYQLRKQGSIVGEVGQTFVGDNTSRRQDKSGMERSSNTITATSDVVAYVWDMHVLREFVKRRPMIGASLQKAISVDLVNKVNQSRDHKEHYRQLLAEALDGGRITSTERRNLQRYRGMHRISVAEHRDRLKEHGWTEEEFEAGFQELAAPKDMSKENFLKYEALLKSELDTGEVKPEARSNLRKFRSQAGIDAQEHLLAIEKQGWTADEYEIGGRAWAAEKYKAGGTSMPADNYFEESSDNDNDNGNERTAQEFGFEPAGSAEKERYRFLLVEALGGGMVEPGKKRELTRYRELHAISGKEHKDLLAEHGWNEEDFEAGFHKELASTFFQQYVALVQSELQKGEASG